MSNALAAGVSGMQAHQKMLDVTGNNLANVNTTAFKSSRVNFSEMLSRTMREASSPTASTGGTDPLQIGSGVGLGGISKNMSGGDLEVTGRPLDVAIEGSGYFVLNDGTQDLYTRAGAFGVDADYYLIDPSTGYRVQRLGSTGVSEGFQKAGDNGIRVPYDVSLPARNTQNINFSGNLSANFDASMQTTHSLQSGTVFRSGGMVAGTATLLSNLDQASGLTGGTLTVAGTDRTGAAITPATLTIDPAATTVGDLLNSIRTAFGDQVAVSLSGGEIVVTDNTSGYSLLDLTLSYDGPGSLELPTYFRISNPGGEAVEKVNLEIFDAKGVSRTLSAAFVHTGQPDTWDLVLTGLTGDIASIDKRRIEGITFQPNGAFGGIVDDLPSTFEVTYANEPGTTTLNLNLGSAGEFNGITQFGGGFTVNPSGQDGYSAGALTSVSFSREGVLVGVFSNGIRKDLACIKLATFQNPAALVSVGNNYFTASANSGEAVTKQGLSGGAGAVRGSSLEKSNVDVTAEFVNLIQAQNGFQANARTIRVANDMMTEITQLIR